MSGGIGVFTSPQFRQADRDYGPLVRAYGFPRLFWGGLGVHSGMIYNLVGFLAIGRSRAIPSWTARDHVMGHIVLGNDRDEVEVGTLEIRLPARCQSAMYYDTVALVAQAQAMPAPKYLHTFKRRHIKVLCMDYCGVRITT